MCGAPDALSKPPPPTLLPLLPTMARVHTLLTTVLIERIVGALTAYKDR